MAKKYKIVLTIVFIMIIILSFLGIGNLIYINYYKEDNAQILNENGLSINYLNGMKFKFKNKERHIKFSLINNSEEDVLFHISLMKFKSSGDIEYSLIENGNIIINHKKLKNNSDIPISDFNQIKINDKKSYELIIFNEKRDNVEFKLLAEKVIESDPNFVQQILNNNYINVKAKTKIASEISNTDEGIIMDIDDNGNTYYFRGNVNKNYVNFADKLWRIVRINGDGTVRIILDDVISSGVIYDNENDINKFKKFDNTTIYNILNNWYKENLENYDEYIENEKYCSDVNKEGNSLNNYIRNTLSYIPSFNCLGTKNSLKIGLLTIDEVIYAGASIDSANTNYYLQKEEIDSWWTMSASKDNESGIYFYSINKDGSINADSVGNSPKNIRPVINLKKDVKMIGDGTKENPFKIE